MNRPWDIYSVAPLPSDLDDLASKRLRNNSNMSTNDFRNVWYCPTCMQKHPPIQNLLVDVPEHRCLNPHCGRNCHVDHRYKITDTILRLAPLEFTVYDQGRSRHCGVYSVIAALDCSRRVRASTLADGIYNAPPFDVKKAVETYQNATNFICGSEPGDMLVDGFDNIPIVLSVAMDQGFPLCLGRYDAPEDTPNFKIKNFFKVDKTDLTLPRRLLASGIPLVTGVCLGSLFRFVTGGTMYYAPAVGDADVAHAIALIGSGIANRNGDWDVFFTARDSGGCCAHPSYEKQGFGSDFNVWASDVFNLWGFRLPDIVVDSDEE